MAEHVTWRSSRERQATTPSWNSFTEWHFSHSHRKFGQPRKFWGTRTNFSDGPDGLLVSDGSSSVRNKARHPEITNNGSTPPDAESHHEAEWVEQDEPGVYITLTALPGGANRLKRVRFSRKRFSETQAEQWWHGHRARVSQQYNIQWDDE